MPRPFENATIARSSNHYGDNEMAIDVYLQIDGIKGESQDDKHKDWIEVTGAHWGIHQLRSATASTGGGHTSERPKLSDLSFSKIDLVANKIA